MYRLSFLTDISAAPGHTECLTFRVYFFADSSSGGYMYSELKLHE